MFFAIADFDNEMLQEEQKRMERQTLMEREIQNLRHNSHNQSQEINYSRNMVQNPPHQAYPPRRNLNPPPPPNFFGIPSEIYSFKLRLCQFLGANMDTYSDSQSQLLYAGSLLSGLAGQWYISLVDLDTLHLPLSYTIDTLLLALEEFFGGGVTLQSRERSLIVRSRA